MKLYTEDEVKRIIKIAFWQDFENGTTEEDIIAKAHSINLPSDEEIAGKAYAWCQIPGDDGYINSGDDYDVHELPAFIAGAKWVVSLLNNKTMGWKSTIDITRTQALALVMDYALQCGNLSDSELEDLLETLGYGDDPKLPYVGHNFNIVKQQDNDKI